MTLAVAGIVVRAGPATLLEGVTLSVMPGEVLAVVGPNGAGKSTLLNVMAGDRRPTRGSVTLAGRPIDSWSGRELALRRAVTGVEATVAFPYTVEEVALLGRGPHHGGRPRPLDHTIVAGLLAATDCGHLADRLYATLSAGERQRVQLARAIAQIKTAEHDDSPPDAASWPGRVEDRADRRNDAPAERFLLLDEPTSSLDPAHQHAALRLVRAVAEALVGVVVVLHDLNLAALYADRVALMHEGHVVAVDTPGRVMRPDVLEAVFGIAMLVLRHPRLDRAIVVPDP